MLEMGILVGLGLLILFAKCNWRWRMKLLSNPVIADVLIFIFLIALHWGTFSGVMVATIGALTCSITLSGMRKLFGYIDRGQYTPGIFDVTEKLK